MRKILTFAVVAGGAMALAACGGGKTNEAPAEPVEAEMMAPAETPAAIDPAVEAAGDVDPTGNPIRPAEATAPEAAPAAE